MHVFDTPGDVTLQVQIPTGRVVVETTDEPRTQIELIPHGRRGQETIEQIDVSHDERGGRHVVSVEQRDRIRWGPIQISWGGEVEVRVSCPTGTELELSGASTDFRADGRYGKVTAKTASGDMRLGDVDGKVEIKTASGDVSLEQIESDHASVVTVSGDVQIGDIDGKLTLRTVSGDVELGAVRGPVTISTTSGDIDLRSLTAGEARAQSVSGDVRIGIAQGTRVYIDAVSVSGELSSELSVGDETVAPDAGNDSDVVPIHVKTVSGDVTLVRVPASVGSGA